MLKNNLIVIQCDSTFFSGNSKYHFNAHMNAHFEHACPQCDYTSRTEGRLKRHIKDFHSDTPPNNFSGSRMLASSPSSFAPMKREPGRPKLFRCRHCDFSSPTKVCTTSCPRLIGSGKNCASLLMCRRVIFSSLSSLSVSSSSSCLH